MSEWKALKDHDSAQELVWASSVYGPAPIVQESLEQIWSTHELSRELRLSARSIIDRRSSAIIELGLDAAGTRDSMQIHVRRLRAQLRILSHDPIRHLELAMSHSRLGENEQAAKALRIALNLAPTSRYILRSAARFYVHIGDLESGIALFDRVRSVDPWIQATRVSLHDLAEVPLRDMKKARELVRSQLPPNQISELAGAMATLELKEGHHGRAKKLFRLGALDPNDNVVAQLQWASSHRGFAFEPKLLDRSLTFEARAFEAMGRKAWDEALRHCERWLDDEPLSVRPAEQGSYIAAELLRDYKKSAQICRFGLVANPHSFTLLNNLAYSCAALDDVAEARKYLRAAKSVVNGPLDDIVLTATEGTVLFREGRYSEAWDLYTHAILEAKRRNAPALGLRAAIHLISEMIVAGSFLTSENILLAERTLNGPSVPEQVRDEYSSLLLPKLLDQRSDGESVPDLTPVLGS